MARHRRRPLPQDHRGGPRRPAQAHRRDDRRDTLEPWCYEATRDNIRHYAHGIGDDNPLWCDPDYAAKTKLRRHHRAAELPVRDQPHRLGLCRRPARRARDVGGRRLDLAQARAAQRRDLDRGLAEGPGRAPDPLRRPRGPADLSRRFLQPAGRPGGRGRQLVLPHRARPRARAGHQVQGGARRARRAATPTRSSPRSTSSTPSEEIRGADAALLGGRERRRGAADDGQGPDDGDRLHRLRAGLGRPLHPRQQARLEAASTRTPASASRTASAFPTAPSACTGRRSSRSRSARPAPTTTAPSAARG